MIAALSTLLIATAPQAGPAPRTPEPVVEPDVSLSIIAHADEVRWSQVGTISIRAWSEPAGPVIEENLSTGLPRPIPGQRTFRDVGWRLDAAARIAGPDEAANPSPPDASPADASPPTEGSPR